jgi:hypothetical protein
MTGKSSCNVIQFLYQLSSCHLLRQTVHHVLSSLISYLRIRFICIVFVFSECSAVEYVLYVK